MSLGKARKETSPKFRPAAPPSFPSQCRELIPKLAFQPLASTQSSAPLPRRYRIETSPIGNDFENPLASISRGGRDFGIPPTQRLRFSAGTFRSWLFRMLVRNACSECQVKSATCGGFEAPCPSAQVFPTAQQCSTLRCCSFAGLKNSFGAAIHRGRPHRPL